MAQASKLSVSVTPQACIVAAFALILVPLPWLFAWLSAAIFHECCHCAAVILSGKHMHVIAVGISGAQILTESLSDSETILCALAGPIGGLLLLVFAPIVPKLAVCGLMQCAFNLLPVYPLDGGRALLSLFRLFLQDSIACKVCGLIRVFFLLGFLIMGILAAVWKMGLMLLLMAILFAARIVKIKIPCK